MVANSEYQDFLGDESPKFPEVSHELLCTGYFRDVYLDKPSDPMQVGYKGSMKDKYYWFNETWTTLYGPYDTLDEANKACSYYAKYML